MREIGRAARGLVAFLVTGTLAVVPMASAQAVAPSVVDTTASSAMDTALTAAEAKAALSAAIDATERRALREGARFRYRWGSSPRGPGWQQVDATVAVDPRRRTVRAHSHLSGTIVYPAVAYIGPCAPNEPGGRNSRTVVKEGVGRWRGMLPKTSLERRGLALLHRRAVRWEFSRSSAVTLERTVRRWGPRSEVRDNLLSDSSVEGATATQLDNGTRYAISLHDRYDPKDLTTVVLDIDAHGAMVTYEATSSRAGQARTYDSSYRVAYGPQQVRIPPRHRTIRTPALVRGCNAAEARITPQSRATSLAEYLNAWSKRTGRPVTAAKIRADYPPGSDIGGGYGVDVRIYSIPGGVQIVGRHRLLRHPYVSTVFVRDGKAVAHRVR